MAEKRMFAKQIVDSDAFLDMPLSAQALYFHLAMRADDDGFVNNPKKIQRMIGASDDDCRLLTMKRFVIAFESGVIVIKHWRIHNYIQKDRYKETAYQEEKAMLVVKDNKAYSLSDKPCIQDVSSLDTQNRIDKIRLEEDEDILSDKKKKESQEIKMIVDCLNEAAGTKYRATSESTARHIRARLNEGFTRDDFILVIEKKCIEWLGTDMAKYLRPETLFGSKFESYLNQRSGARRGANGIALDERKDDDLDGIL